MKPLFIPLAAMSLSSCATVLTPSRCETAMAGLTTVEQIAAVLVNNGVEADKASQIASAILIGKVALATACATARVTE